MKLTDWKSRKRQVTKGLVIALCLAMGLPLPVVPVMAQNVVTTPQTPQELPVEMEIELAPAASLKQAPLWKELEQLLDNPYSPVVRRPGFGAVMPSLNVWPLGYLPHTGQPLRLRVSDGEVSWDQPGPLFDPTESVAVDANNVPTELRTVIGELVASDDDVLDAGEVDRTAPCTTCGYLIVSNPNNNGNIPPDGTVVSVPGFDTGQGPVGALVDVDGNVIAELEKPVSESDFFRAADDVRGLRGRLRNLPRGRPAAEILGKALFWDMQVGSDGVQSCGTCHFNAGVDNRTKNQLNPDHLGGDLTLQVKGPNQDVVAADFPFHQGGQDDLVNDANDVMSSMGVRFRQFVNIPPIGPNSFGAPFRGVRPLRPDRGTAVADPIPVFQDLRRVEPRNTPTMHAAAFNFDNFWDGRARFHFNGGSVFGPSDPQFHIFVNNGNPGGALHGLPHPEDRSLPLSQWEPPTGEEAVPVRIKFSSLASQATGPPLSDFEMSFAGRNWPKLGKKMLQDGVTPLANQLVSPTDSVLGPYSNQRSTVGGPVNRLGRPGLNISYDDLIRLAFKPELWRSVSRHLDGTPAPCDPNVPAENGVVSPEGCDPFDGYVLTIANGAARPRNRNQFTQMEANFSLFFALAAQTYEELLIPDDTPFDKFMDANPLAANAVGQPGEQGVLFPTLVPALVDTGSCPAGTTRLGSLCFPDLATFGPDELFGFDIFGGANLTAALPPGPASAGRSGIQRNPVHSLVDQSQIAVGSNPFNRSARCMLCHAGPEQTDHTINFAHGLLKGDAEIENPTPPQVNDPRTPPSFPDGLLPAPEATGPFKVVSGFVLADELIENAQDAVESEPRNMHAVDGTEVDRIVSVPSHFAFGDQGIYNIGVRPFSDDVGRGGNDPWGWPLSASAMALKNVGGADFEPCDLPTDACIMANFDPSIPGGGLFEPTGADQSVNPGLAMEPINPQLPAHLAEWTNNLPAGELHPQIDELAFSPNTITPPNGGPAIEFGEVLFGADVHCGVYDPATFGAGSPNFGWGPRCPNSQSTVPNNIGLGVPNAYVPGSLVFPLHGSWPVPNRVVRVGAFKAPQLRNVELTGPYFHSGNVLTLRQVVDFYMEGGEFPRTNAEHRDAHIINVDEQVFSFGRSTGADLAPFADALPDPQYQYDAMPDTDHATTPEYATPEEAKVSLVRFLLSLTDERVRFERAPFDRPEIFVPVDGTAPDNTGRRDLLLDARFKQVPAVGAEGNATPVSAFLGVTANPNADCVTEISHFCQ